MTLQRGTRFDVAHDQVFPQGALMQGEVVPDMEYVSNEDMARGKRPAQRVDEATGLAQWKVLVQNPAAEKERDASVTVTLLSEVQPVPPEAIQVMPGVQVRPVEFTEVTAEPRVMGDRFKYQGYVIRAKGIQAPTVGMRGSGTGSPAGGAKAPSAGKSGGAATAEKPAA